MLRPSRWWLGAVPGCSPQNLEIEHSLWSRQARLVPLPSIDQGMMQLKGLRRQWLHWHVHVLLCCGDPMQSDLMSLDIFLEMVKILVNVFGSRMDLGEMGHFLDATFILEHLT